ncbi:sensor histidine kinase [Humidisolicoccus flavus]|uniref:sensor histidine kinase n=1 Tax=Humidisolicoccus flavus TaxID=3111414 RepID=UPI00324A887B
MDSSDVDRNAAPIVLAHIARIVSPILFVLGAGSSLLAGDYPLETVFLLTALSLLGCCAAVLIEKSETPDLLFATVATLCCIIASWLLQIGPSAPVAAVLALSTTLVSGAAAAIAASVFLTRAKLWWIPLIFAGLAVSVAAMTPSASQGSILGTAFTWFGVLITAAVLTSSINGGMRRVRELAQSFALERAATELEGQRRASARLLHDTVLASLTLLAHGGRGIPEEELRMQTMADASLLARLRAGEVPSPESSGSYSLQGSSAVGFSTALQEVRARFASAGLAIEVSGNTADDLAPNVRSDLMLALIQCVENVRRHAGVDTVSVSFTGDETCVQVLVVDAGVGFDPSAVSSTRLGFAESVIERLAVHGGDARVFSAPGAGTTIVLRVPR